MIFYLKLDLSPSIQKIKIKNSLKNKIKDREPVLINSKDAKDRSIKNNDIVLIHNKRGRVLAGARLSDSIMKGVLILSTGAWFDPDYEINLDLHGNPNVLTRDKGTSKLGQGPIAHSCLIDIELCKDKAPIVTAHVPPIIIREN